MEYICSKCSLKMDVSTKKAKCDWWWSLEMDFKPPKFDLSLVDNSTCIFSVIKSFHGIRGEILA